MDNVQKKEKECYFCVNAIEYIDYKDMATIKKFMSSYAKIVGRKRTGVCAKHQRQLGLAIKRSRFLGLVSYTMR